MLRAVLPPEERPLFWHSNGKISAAAFMKRDGLSVDRTMNRTIPESVAFMRKNHLRGPIVGILVPYCNDAEVLLVACPSDHNRYHCEIHGSASRIPLSRVQAAKLAKHAVVWDSDDCGAEYRSRKPPAS